MVKKIYINREVEATAELRLQIHQGMSTKEQFRAEVSHKAASGQDKLCDGISVPVPMPVLNHDGNVEAAYQVRSIPQLRI